MEGFTFQCQTKIIFGRGTESKVGPETAKHSRNVLLHYGTGSIKKFGLYGRVTESLEAAGVRFTELPGAVPNPRIGLVREGVKLCREKKIDFILAVGGGSVIDSAKAIAAGFYHEGDPWDFFSRQIEAVKALPIGVVLTIPAAGSESSPNCVITNDETKRKLSMSGPALRPVFSVLDPELTLTLPKFQVACGIADMMAHVIERYFTRTDHVDLTDELCEAVLRTMIRNARLTMEHPEDYNPRAELVWASTVAHNGLLGTGRVEDWASHKIEHEMSAIYDVAHGAGLAVVFPAWMMHVRGQGIGRFARFARNVWGAGEADDAKAALMGIEATRGFFREIGLPVTLKELGIGSDRLEEMARKCAHRGPIGNFAKLGENDILAIYRSALE